MKYIPLGGKYGVGKHAIVDDADYETLSAHKWYVMKNGYATRTIDLGRLNGKKRTRAMTMHRQLMGEPTLLVDHCNNDRLDNRRSNLRLATKHENTMNRVLHKNSSTGFKGVFFRKECPNKPYYARVGMDRKYVHLGYFKHPEEAAQAYNTKAKELFGEFALLNNINQGVLPEARTVA